MRTVATVEGVVSISLKYHGIRVFSKNVVGLGPGRAS